MSCEDLRSELLKLYLNDDKAEFIKRLIGSNNDVIKLIAGDPAVINKLPTDIVKPEMVSYLIYENPKIILNFIDIKYSLQNYHYDLAISKDISLYAEIEDIDDHISDHVKCMVNLYTSLDDDVDVVVHNDSKIDKVDVVDNKINELVTKLHEENKIETPKKIMYNADTKRKYQMYMSYLNNIGKRKKSPIVKSVIDKLVNNGCVPVYIDNLVDMVQKDYIETDSNIIRKNIHTLTCTDKIINDLVLRNNVDREQSHKRKEIILEIANNLMKEKTYAMKSNLINDIKDVLDRNHNFTYSYMYINTLLRNNNILNAY